MSNSDPKSPVMAGLRPEQELELQQLLELREWHEKGTGRVLTPTEVPAEPRAALPSKWELMRGVTLHEWQQQCVEAWFVSGKRGVIKVVTGAGKTLLALAIAERLQHTEAPNLRVAIVVPTVVLMEQWKNEVLRGNLPSEAISLMGGGYQGHTTDSTRVLISVLNSAAVKLPELVEKRRLGGHLLLIVDECHRAGAAQMRRIFETHRAYSLGLSATPEREDENEEFTEGLEVTEVSTQPKKFDESTIGRELGPVIFELNYAQAVSQGILPQFSVIHLGLSLKPEEKEKYDRISAEIRELRSELETGQRRGMALVRWCRSKAASDNPKAARFIALTGERKRLLYRMSNRSTAVSEIVAEASTSDLSQGILFHESIEQVMLHFAELQKLGYAVLAEHSRFSDEVRSNSLQLFRNGTARILVSARSLIEGFNVPAADFGIIVAASSSVRQRVQTLGRLLRRHRAPDGTEKRPTLYVLYAAGTVDEVIYEKADWDEFIGPERNEYFLWPDLSKSPERVAGPPRRPRPSEVLIDLQDLLPGELYPGDPDEGTQYSIDLQGNVQDEFGNLMQPSQELLSILEPYRKRGGRFRVTPKKKFVFKLSKIKDGWECIYLGSLKRPLSKLEEPTDISLGSLQAGDPYPIALAKGKVFSVLQRDPRLIALKSRNGVKFVVPAETLPDPWKSRALREIQQRLAALYAKGHRMSKIVVTQSGHVVCLFANQAYFVGNAPEGAAGFLMENE